MSEKKSKDIIEDLKNIEHISTEELEKYILDIPLFCETTGVFCPTKDDEIIFNLIIIELTKRKNEDDTSNNFQDIITTEYDDFEDFDDF
jgi:hypothetical protein